MKLRKQKFSGVSFPDHRSTIATDEYRSDLASPSERQAGEVLVGAEGFVSSKVTAFLDTGPQGGMGSEFKVK